ncbi:MAG: tetratricopeptide repeat protein [Candidatus Latescibacterota bacterium]
MRGRDLLFPMAVAGAGLAAYANSLAGVFVFDDLSAIVDNARLRRLWPPQQVIGASFRPLLVYTLALNHAVGGLDPWSYHVVNAAVHLLAGMVLYGLVRRTLELDALRPRWGGHSRWLALGVAGVWVVHPLHTQSVTYVIQRGESLAGLFYLTTLYSVARGASGRRSGAWYWVAAVANLCGLATKEIAVTVPLAVLLYDGLLLSRSFRGALRRRGGLYLGLATPGVAAAGWLLVQHPEVLHGDASTTPALRYALTQAGVVVRYLRLCVWPHPLCLDHRWPLVTGWGDAVGPLAGVSALLLLAVWLTWRRQPLGFPLAFFFLVVAPTSSFVPLLDPLTEHRLYLPLAAVVALAVLGAWSALQALSLPVAARRVLAAGLLCSAVLVLGQRTVARNVLYHRGTALWRDVLAQYPHNPRAHNNLAVHLVEEGDLALAAFHWALALRLAPGYAEALNNIGGFWVLQGQFEQAVASFEKALLVRPGYAEAHEGLGQALAALGRLNEAAAHFEEAGRLLPGYARAAFDLGVVRVRQGRLEEARACFAEAVRWDPSLHAAGQPAR